MKEFHCPDLPLLNGASFLLASNMEINIMWDQFLFQAFPNYNYGFKISVFQNRCLKPTFMQLNIQCCSPKILDSAGPPEAKGSHHTVKKAARRINTQSGSLNLQPGFCLLILKELHKSWFKEMSTGKDLGEEAEKAGQFGGNIWEKNAPFGY